MAGRVGYTESPPPPPTHKKKQQQTNKNNSKQTKTQDRIEQIEWDTESSGQSNSLTIGDNGQDGIEQVEWDTQSHQVSLNSLTMGQGGIEQVE